MMIATVLLEINQQCGNIISFGEMVSKQQTGHLTKIPTTFVKYLNYNYSCTY